MEEKVEYVYRSSERPFRKHPQFLYNVRLRTERSKPQKHRKDYQHGIVDFFEHRITSIRKTQLC